MNQILLLGFAIVILFLIIVIVFFLYAWSAKKTLLKGQSSWSAKNLPIRSKKSNLRRDKDFSLLESISSKTNEYLQSEEELSEETPKKI